MGEKEWEKLLDWPQGGLEDAGKMMEAILMSHQSGDTRRGRGQVTDRRRLGVLLPDAGLTEPDVSRSSVDDQEDRS
ncbi:hypothetical protein CRUP_026791 [Coryphaenoides rupestris]|nr:hypothetical protein CRUP_026791 [Coryphaenoides rupestris]